MGIPLFKSMLCTSICLLGLFHSLAGGFVIDHKRESSLAVVTVEFLVEQNIIIGFLQVCAPITSGSLYIHLSVDLLSIRSRDTYLELHILSNAKSFPFEW